MTGNMEPALRNYEVILQTETLPEYQCDFLSYLITLRGQVTEWEQEFLDRSDFMQAAMSLKDPIRLGWLYEMRGEQEKAKDIY